MPRTFNDTLKPESTAEEIALAAESIKPALIAAATRNGFVLNTVDLFEAGFSSEEKLYPSIADLFKEFRQVSLTFPGPDRRGTETIPFENVLRTAVGRAMPARKQKHTLAFQIRLNFINELISKRILPPRAFCACADEFVARGKDYFIPYLYDILRNIDDLQTRKGVMLKMEEKQAFDTYSCLLAGTLLRHNLVKDYQEIFDYVTRRDGARRHVHVAGCDKQRDSPAPRSAKPKSPRAPPVEQARVVNVSEKSRNLIKNLNENPDYVKDAVKEIREFYESDQSPKNGTFHGFFNILLDHISDLKSPISPGLSGLVDSFKKLSFKKRKGDRSSLELSRLVSKWFNNKIHIPESVHLVSEFFEKFWFYNELLQRHVIKHESYKALANLTLEKRLHPSISRAFFIYQLLRNVEELARAGFWKAESVKGVPVIYQRCYTRLVTWLETIKSREPKPSPETIREIEEFIATAKSNFEGSPIDEAGNGEDGDRSHSSESRAVSVVKEAVGVDYSEMARSIISKLEENPESVEEALEQINLIPSSNKAEQFFFAFLDQVSESKPSLSPGLSQLLDKLPRKGDRRRTKIDFYVPIWFVRKSRIPNTIELVDLYFEKFWFFNDLLKRRLIDQKNYKTLGRVIFAVRNLRRVPIPRCVFLYRFLRNIKELHTGGFWDAEKGLAIPSVYKTCFSNLIKWTNEPGLFESAPDLLGEMKEFIETNKQIFERPGAGTPKEVASQSGTDSEGSELENELAACKIAGN